MTGKRAVLLLGMLLLGLTAGAQERPNFSGKWKMNAPQSDFGPQAGPDSLSYVIVHKGPNIDVDYTADGRTTHISIKTDGEERVTESHPDVETLTKAYWAGPVLTLDSRQKARPAHESTGIKWTSRWTLSPDGKVLVIQKHFTSPNGEARQKLVFDRQ